MEDSIIAGNREGGLKAAAKNKENNPNFYREIALEGQRAWAENGRKPRGFSVNRELAREAGRKGGITSRRGKKQAA